MEDTVNFLVYYGPGEVTYDQFGGVDLSAFACCTATAIAPARRNIGWVRDWLAGSFGMDPQIYDVVVHALQWNVVWMLKPISRTREWRQWFHDTSTASGGQFILFVQFTNRDMAAALALSQLQVEEAQEIEASHEHDAVQTEEGGGESVGFEVAAEYAEGQADGGEVREDLVVTMEMDDQTALAEGAEIEAEMDGHGDGDAEGTDTSENEDGPVDPTPAAWNSDARKGMSVEDERMNPWEYRDNEVLEGATYRDKESLQNAVKLWGMSTQREFRTKTSSKQSYTAVCTEPTCRSYVQASIGKYDLYWVVRTVVPHNCVRDGVLEAHRNLTSALIASLLYREIVENVSIETKFIQTYVRNKYQYNISYAKAWRAKQKALEMRFGSFLDSYHNLPALLCTLQGRNPGTHVDIVTTDDSTFQLGQKVLHRAFFAFGTCIQAFQYCRPVLCVDGTFLTGKYKGQILTAVGIDGNNQLLPVAMAFVEREDYGTWLWFLQQLKVGVVHDRPNVCVIHDRHAGLVKAIKQLLTSDFDTSDPIVWRDIQSRWCMRHLGANFFTQFSNKRLMNLFKRLCGTNQKKKFDVLWAKLDELTESEVKQRRGRASSSTDDVPEPLCALPGVDPPNRRRRSSRQVCTCHIYNCRLCSTIKLTHYVHRSSASLTGLRRSH